MSAKSSLTLLIIALALGAAGAGLSMLYLKAREAELVDALKPKSQPIQVVVASRDLVKGDRLDTSTLSVRAIPSDYVNPDAIKPDEFESIKGLVLIQNLASGRTLLRSFIDQEYPLDFSDTIPLKRRGMTIQIDEVNSFSGLLRPGNRIDILVNMPPDPKIDGPKATKKIMPVLENVEVLATGKQTAKGYEEKVRLLRGGVNARPDKNFTTVTLNLTPKESALLGLAKDKGDLLALLRNRKDASGSGFTGIDNNSLSQNAAQLALAAKARSTCTKLDDNLVVGEDGVLRTKGGTELKSQNLKVAEDGSIITSNGINLSGRGLCLDDDGNIVTADGKFVNPDEILIADDGTIMTKDGTILTGSKSMTAGKLKRRADGAIVTENGIAIAGATMNKDGKLVLADGTVVDPNDVVIRADGTVMTKDGKILKGVSAGKLAGKLKVDANGNVVTADGTIIKGAKLRDDGMMVLADGTVVDPNKVVMNADGTVSVDGKVLAGVSLDKSNVVVADQGSGAFGSIDYIVGGVSSDSVATVNKLPLAGKVK